MNPEALRNTEPAAGKVPYWHIKIPVQRVGEYCKKNVDLIFSSGLFNQEYRGQITGARTACVYEEMLIALRDALAVNGRMLIVTGTAINAELEQAFHNAGLYWENLTDAAGTGYYLAARSQPQTRRGGSQFGSTLVNVLTVNGLLVLATMK